MNAVTFSLLATSMQPFSSSLRASMLPSTASTLPSVQPPTFVRFLFFYCFFVTFVFFILRCHLLFFITSCAFSYYLSLFLLDEASGRKVVNSTACCSTVFCSLTYVNTFHPRLIAELLLCFALRCSHSRLFCALGWSLLRLQLCVRFHHLRSSAFPPFATGFFHFRTIHT